MKNTAITNLLFLSILASCFFYTGLPSAFGQQIEDPFTVWMMNNEARTISILSNDRQLIEKMSSPLSILPVKSRILPKTEEILWQTHVKFYSLISELGKIFRLYRNVILSGILHNVPYAKPGEWITSAFIGNQIFLTVKISPFINGIFQDDVVTALGIDRKHDSDLIGRMQNCIKSLSDTERRMLNDYLETFLALYPTNRETRTLKDFLEKGIPKDRIITFSEFIRSREASCSIDTAETHEPGILDVQAASETKPAATEAAIKDDSVPELLETKPPEKATGKDSATPSADIFDIW